MKAKLFFEIDGIEKSEIIELEEFEPIEDEQELIEYLSNNQLIEFVFDSIDAGVELIKEGKNGV